MTNKASAVQGVQKLQQGAKKHLGKTKTVTLGSQDYKPSDINAALQTVIDTAADTETKKAAYHDAVDAQNKATAAAQPLVLGLTSYVYLAYGNANEVLADFGLSPRKKRKPTVKTKAGALDKAAKTRQARGTMSKAQKDQIVAEPPATVPPTSGVTTNGAAVATSPAAKAPGGAS